MTDDIKLPLTSAGITEALLAQLRDAAPQIFSEGHVDFARLQAALGEHIDTNPERYGLTWAGKRDAFRNVQVPSVATLRPQPEESVNWDSSENLIIEGDNLEVLKLLQKPYHGKVKMIYIDPPYNTGNEFIYPDNFREGLDEYLRYTGQLGEDGTATSTNKDTSGRYHSNWLNMMYPRLFLARNLLKEDGVIFVSIDDHEVHNLRLLMDEVFGEENFISQLVVLTNPKGRVLDRHFSRTHDYLLVYSRGDLEKDLSLAKEDDEVEDNYPEIDAGGRFRLLELRNTHRQFGKFNRHKLWYALFVDTSTGEIFSKDAPGRVEVWPRWDDGFEGCWTWGVDKATNENSLLVGRLVGARWKVYRKSYSHNEAGEVARKKLKSILIDATFHTEKGQAAFDALIPGRIFQSPKPPELIKKLVGLSGEKDDIVLDFFAGSGTTAHAVLDLNQEDGGNRRFILVQLPEKTDNPQYPTIAHITRERVRRVIAKLQENRHSRAGGNPAIQNALDLNPLDSRLRGNDDAGDLGFRAFKLDSSNFKIWRSDQAPQSAEQLAEQLNLYADNVLAERGDQDRLYELILKSGRPLSARVESVAVGGHTAFSVGDGDLLICLEPHLDRDTLRALFAHKPQMVLCLDVAFDGNDALKTNTVLEAQSHGIVFKTV